MNKNVIIFKQSNNDFPLTVSLDGINPTWVINRWQGNNGLNFIPVDDEGFTLRGDKQRLLYIGRRRSHRFTILNDGAFEYDCILKREPESNVITLRMENAEQYDFFKQPDFVHDPFLKGSYAVYLKDTLIGQGTGKLCHIHRPLIIDALGRKCWGDLSVVKNELHITIPEWWLSNAKYPVTVDPTVGTNTEGSQNKWIPDDDEYLTELYFEFGMPINRYLVSETIDGLCTAYYYTNKHDSEAGGRPILYSDNANKPQTRKSSNENFIDLRFSGGNNAGWRSGTFTGGSISAGSYIWFGLFTEYFWYPRFDYGVTCYAEPWTTTIMPNNYPRIVDTFSLKLSMFFIFNNATNYVRVITQGVNLSDNCNKLVNYKRVLR